MWYCGRAVCEAFAMGLQARLGEGSLLLSLDGEVMKMIITAANKLPVLRVPWSQQESDEEDPESGSDSSESGSDEED